MRTFTEDQIRKIVDLLKEEAASAAWGSPIVSTSDLMELTTEATLRLF